MKRIISVLFIALIFGIFHGVSEARVMVKLAAKDQLVEFSTLIKKIEQFDGMSIIDGDRTAFTIIRETTELLTDNLRTQSGKRKAARLMLWSTLVHEFAENADTISDYE